MDLYIFKSFNLWELTITKIKARQSGRIENSQNNEFSDIDFVIMFEQNNTALAIAKYIELLEISFKSGKNLSQLHGRINRITGNGL